MIYIQNRLTESTTTHAEEQISNPFHYAGEAQDSVTGLYYLRARYYDPETARFTQEDDYLGDGRNLYTYVKNNPPKYVDPTGYAGCVNKERVEEGLEKIFDGLMKTAVAVSGVMLATAVAAAAGPVASAITTAMVMKVPASAALVPFIDTVVSAGIPVLSSLTASVSINTGVMGVADVDEGIQDVYHGVKNDNKPSYNMVRDGIFHADERQYQQQGNTMLTMATTMTYGMYYLYQMSSPFIPQEQSGKSVSGYAHSNTSGKGGTGAQGVGNPVKIEGRGSTGRTTPNTLNEQMAMNQVQSNPLTGATKVPLEMTDTRWPASEGWVKMQSVVQNADGTKTTIHYLYNEITGAFDDFKFK